MLKEILHNFDLLFSDHIVFSIGLLLFIGYFAGKLVEKIQLPSITGYILTGLVLGEAVLGIIPKEMVYRLSSITEITLGLIALIIGAEFKISKIKQFGIPIFILTFFQAMLAFVFVTVLLFLLGMEIKIALLLGAISTATAPAATVFVIRQLKAKGKFVDYLYGIVAFDDALCVVIFSIVLSIVGPMFVTTQIAHDAHSGGILTGFLHAMQEITLSIILGVISGVILNFISRKKYRLNKVYIIAIAIIFLNISVALILNLSLLIANMVLGATLINLSSKNKRIFEVVEPISSPIFALFFILAGTELELSVFSQGIVLLFGAAYIVSRFLGKYLGIVIGGKK